MNAATFVHVICQNQSSVRSPLDRVLQRFIVLTPHLFQFYCKSHLEYSIAVVFRMFLY